ncbi:hypothetical protein [Candidatus Kryptobacter tengchongensis]|uniref:hypothetical protein n=1 Tax=Kryptobacter tengchongensis TaxID=1643429 RepID=UPI0007077D13|nr:hypothetical protein [Candidatus Kryptobacter tengchongensis]CUS92517.1 hypothetical protein JGI20_01497 [Candidatus Kryptobacter tengchongensis]
MFKNEKAKYFLILVFRAGDCPACLDFIVPLLTYWGDSLNVNIFGLYADNDTIRMKRITWLYKIKFRVFSDPDIVNTLSLKRTPCVLFVTGRGAVVYSYFPDYLKPDRGKKFFLKVSAILRGNNLSGQN